MASWKMRETRSEGNFGESECDLLGEGRVSAEEVERIQ